MNSSLTMQPDSSARPKTARPVAAIAFSIWAALIVAHAAPLSSSYLNKLTGLHGPIVTGAVLAAGALLFATLAAGLRSAAGATWFAAAAVAVTLTIPSGNLAGFSIAILILLMTVLLGDVIFRVVHHEEATRDDIWLLFATGLVGGGLLILVMGEFRILGRLSLATFAVILLALRYQRALDLARSLRCSLSWKRLSWIDSFAVAFVLAVLFAAWAIALTPDVSWDALMYHLPEIRDIVIRNRVELVADLFPQTLFWRNHEAYLSIGYFFGGERAVRILHFAAGAATFAAASLLANRLRRPISTPLLFLAIAAFSFGVYQMRATYVDWVCALLVTLAAAQLLDRERRGASVLAGILFGGAIATKIFAVFAGLAIVILLARNRRGAARRFAGFLLGVTLSLGPWMLWSQTHSGFPLAPLAPDAQTFVARITGGYFLVAPSIAEGTSTASSSSHSQRHRGITEFLRLPYALTYESRRFEAFGNGYGGVVALMLLPGIFGWSRRHLGLFLVAIVPPLCLWFLMYEPSSRYLMPLYPLYAVFAMIGLTRLTDNFSGAAGRAAAATLVIGAIVLPVQFGSSGVEWKTALGILSREEALAIQVQGYPLMKHLTARDRVVFFGEFDRYHCPAERAYRVAYSPLESWKADPEKWRAGLRELGITHIVYHGEFHPRLPLLEALSDMIELQAENGIAKLYRVRRVGDGPVRR